MKPKNLIATAAVAASLLAGCSWMKPDPAQQEASRAAAPRESGNGEFDGMAAIADSHRARIKAARAEQLSTHEQDYSFCRGDRCPPRTAKTISYSSEPEVRLQGVTTQGEGQVAALSPSRAERRTLTAAAFAADGRVDPSAAAQVGAFAKRYASGHFKVIYWIASGASAQDELRATQRAVELQKTLMQAGIPKSRIAMRSEKNPTADGRVAEILVSEAGS